MHQARRNLLKGGLLAMAAAAATMTSSAHAAMEPKSKNKREDRDVVVIGAGFAGLCAALEAKEQGAHSGKAFRSGDGLRFNNDR